MFQLSAQCQNEFVVKCNPFKITRCLAKCRDYSTFKKFIENDRLCLFELVKRFCNFVMLYSDCWYMKLLIKAIITKESEKPQSEKEF